MCHCYLSKICSDIAKNDELSNCNNCCASKPVALALSGQAGGLRLGRPLDQARQDCLEKGPTF